MQNLTETQIKIIIDDVTSEGITFSHLHDELVDHICCMVEDSMYDGLSFNEAYEKARKKFSKKGLKKVQEETLLLIDKKYRIMKTLMKTIGMVSMIMITIGALFKIQHWQGAGILLSLGFLLLGAVFMPSALWVMKKESKLKGSLFIYLISIIGGIAFIFGFLFKIQHWPWAGIMLTLGFSIIAGLLLPAILISKLMDANSKHLRLTYIIGYFALAWYLMGTLFKIQHWAGAAIMLILGAIGLTTVFFPMYVAKVYKKQETIKASFLYLCIGIVFFNMFNLLLSLTVSKDVMSLFVKQGKEIMKTTNFLENKNNILVEELRNDTLYSDTSSKIGIDNIKAIADELCQYIEKNKIELISWVDGVSESDAEAAAKNPAMILNKDNFQTPTLIFCGNETDSVKGKGSELKKKIQDYKEILLNYCNEDENAKQLISKSLATDSIYNKEEEMFLNWEMDNFYHLVTISVINKLSHFQRNVRIAEKEALESILINKQPRVASSEINN